MSKLGRQGGVLFYRVVRYLLKKVPVCQFEFVSIQSIDAFSIDSELIVAFSRPASNLEPRRDTLGFSSNSSFMKKLVVDLWYMLHKIPKRRSSMSVEYEKGL